MSMVQQDRGGRKFNLVFHGVQECANGTSRVTRQKEDLEKLSALCFSLDSTVTGLVTKDHLRLGKFSSNQKRPRPIRPFSRCSECPCKFKQVAEAIYG